MPTTLDAGGIDDGDRASSPPFSTLVAAPEQREQPNLTRIT